MLNFQSRHMNYITAHPDNSGIERYCNICGFRFKKFLLFNATNPREAQCPVCKSLERHRHLYIHLLSLYPFLNGAKILHFAPERVLSDILRKSGAEYYDADIDPKKAKYQIDITNIPFDENFFDYIICIHVLEHIPDDIKAMHELFRVTKPGGIVFLCVPFRDVHAEGSTVTDSEERAKLFGQFDHVRGYSLDVFCERLRVVGFNTDRISLPNAFAGGGGVEDALLGRDKIVLARKMS